MSPLNYHIKVKRIPNNVPGKIIRHFSSKGLEHELATARSLVCFGFDVYFMKPSRQANVHTADCIFRGICWEIKSPKRNSQNAIIRDLKDATFQSKNIIIDVRRSGRSVRQTSVDIVTYMRKRRTKKIERILVLDRDYYCLFSRNEVL